MFETRSTATRSRLLWIAGQTAVVATGVFVYFRVRGLTESSTAVALDHGRDLYSFEERVGLDLETELQAVVAPSQALQTFANWVYIWGHWPAIVITMVWLALHHRRYFRRLRDGMLISGAVGMVIFVTYPVAPPRLAGLGLVDTVTEQSHAYRVLQPPAFTNQYAAMPSLHSGWDLLVGIAIVGAASTLLLRIVGFALPVLMGLAVVATANHYLVDVIAGVAIVLVAHALAIALEHRRYRKGALERRVAGR